MSSTRISNKILVSNSNEHSDFEFVDLSSIRVGNKNFVPNSNEHDDFTQGLMEVHPQGLRHSNSKTPKKILLTFQFLYENVYNSYKEKILLGYFVERVPHTTIIRAWVEEI
jgi:hypothetical protein